ncbi:MAG: hypothetical protein KC418_20785 [Anaerolineales bacterium]|nr:hypothetical protein [Anaerolineales bacterium]MCB8953544.1 hypothetical protein [Ardenticatenales bacterium]
MRFFNRIPQITPPELARRRAAGDALVLLDVREPMELRYASLGDGVELAPLSRLAALGIQALPASVVNDKTAEIVVICHHGNRSAQVTTWLQQQGWTNVLNLTGGIDAYARQVDPSVGSY